MKAQRIFSSIQRLVGSLIVATVAIARSASAQPGLISSSPTNGAVNVPTSSAVTFRFSEPMNTVFSGATFVYSNVNFVLTAPVWSASNTVLTCTPIPSFPANVTISWLVFGRSAGGPAMTNVPTGVFTTGAGFPPPVNTNQLTFITAGMTHVYYQTSSALPEIYAQAPYHFLAAVSLASDRTANAISVTAPTSAEYTLAPSFPKTWDWSYLGNETNLITFDTRYPRGVYLFKIQSSASNQFVSVLSPLGLEQPPAPHLNNFDAAQKVDATQPFTLTWDPFFGGTPQDLITAALTKFGTINTIVLTPTGLPGSATSILISANTLETNSAYALSLNFYHWINTTNGGDNIAQAFRVTNTQLVIQTLGTNSFVLNDPVFDDGALSFEVQAPAATDVTIEFKSSLSSTTWQTLDTYASGDGRFTVSVPIGTTPMRFFRARIGP